MYLMHCLKPLSISNTVLEIYYLGTIQKTLLWSVEVFMQAPRFCYSLEGRGSAQIWPILQGACLNFTCENKVSIPSNAEMYINLNSI